MYGHNPNCCSSAPTFWGSRKKSSIFRWLYGKASCFWNLEGFVGWFQPEKAIHKDQMILFNERIWFFSPFPTGLQTPNLLSQEPSPNRSTFVCLELPRVEVQKMGRCFGREASVKPLWRICRTILGHFFSGFSHLPKNRPLFSQVKRISLGCLVLKLE